VHVSDPDLEDSRALAAEVTGLDVTLLNGTNLDLSDLALHVPDAGFGDQDLYPDVVDKAAILIVRLDKNPPMARSKL
jgi:death-on-curing protein